MLRRAECQGKRRSFPHHWARQNPYARKLTYSSCPYPTWSLGHIVVYSLAGVPKCTFQLIIFDAFYVGCKLLRAQIWDSASLLLSFLAVDFSKMTEHTRIKVVPLVLQKCPQLTISLVVKDLKLNIQSFSVMHDSCPSPPYSLRPGTSSSPGQLYIQGTSTKIESTSTAKEPKSAKCFLADLI